MAPTEAETAALILRGIVVILGASLVFVTLFRRFGLGVPGRGAFLA